MWQQRRRALSFGADAHRYHRARPAYPDDLVSDLMRHTPTRVLDVGCGTGKAARLFAARGCQVLGVEPDPAMAAVAAAHGRIDVEVATFEDWHPRGRTFELVISGQAWHWVHPDAGTRKAADVLADGGRLAAFWNRAFHDDAVRADLDEIYARVAPSISGESVMRGSACDARLGHDLGVAGSGDLAPDADRVYHWDLPYGTAEYLDLLQTHSDHLTLPPDVLQAVLAQIGALIDGLGGQLVVHYRTTLRTAVRLPRDR